MNLGGGCNCSVVTLEGVENFKRIQQLLLIDCSPRDLGSVLCMHLPPFICSFNLYSNSRK